MVNFKKKSTGDLNEKLNEIERIRNFQRARPIKRKKLKRFNENGVKFNLNKEETFLHSDKISKSTYECVR